MRTQLFSYDKHYAMHCCDSRLKLMQMWYMHRTHWQVASRNVRPFVACGVWRVACGIFSVRLANYMPIRPAAIASPIIKAANRKVLSQLPQISEKFSAAIQLEARIELNYSIMQKLQLIPLIHLSWLHIVCQSGHLIQPQLKLILIAFCLNERINSFAKIKSNSIKLIKNAIIW